MEGLTPSASLQAAITRNDLAAVSYVLDSLKVDLVKTDDIGRAPIHTAIDADCDEDIIALIIARLPDWSDVQDLVDRYGYTPFMLAVERHKFNVAKTLMDMGGTICDDHDTYCPADRLVQKRATIDHAKILLETRGDFSQAYSKALAWNIPTFLTLFGDLHDALKHDLFDLFRQLAKRGDNATFKKLIPLSVDQGASELAKACSLGDTTLATALFSGGADEDRAFYDSISSPAVDSQAAHALMTLGINKSQALARALVDGDAQDAEALLILGADLDDALTLLGLEDRDKVQDLLIGAQ